MRCRNAVDDARDADRVIRSAPLLTCNRDPTGNCAVNVGVFVRLDVAVRPAGPHKHTQIGCDLLLEIHRHAAAALILADGGDVGGAPVIAANAIASAKLPMLPRLRKPVTATLPGCPQNS